MTKHTKPAGWHRTADEIARSANLQGSRIILTGASSGIGRETARTLAKTGADLLLAVRDEGQARSLDTELGQYASGTITCLTLDLSEPSSIAAFAALIDGPVHRVIFNAGVSMVPQTHLASGLELRFAINHLGHFILANLLRPRMEIGGSRLIVVSSAAHKGLPVQLDDLDWRRRPFSFAAYGESKSANILFALEADRRWRSHGITCNAVLPGTAMTGLQRHHSDEMKRRIGFVRPDGTQDPFVKTVAEAAATTVWAATSPELEGRGGLVLEDCAEAQLVGPDTHPWSGFDPASADLDVAKDLWDRSVRIAGSIAPDLLKTIDP